MAEIDDLEDILNSALDDFHKGALAAPSSKPGEASSSGLQQTASQDGVKGLGMGLAALGQRNKGKKKISSKGSQTPAVSSGAASVHPRETSNSRGEQGSSSSSGAGPSSHGLEAVGLPGLKPKGERTEETGKQQRLQATLEQLAERTKETVKEMKEPAREPEGGTGGAGLEGLGGVEGLEGLSSTPEDEEMIEKLMKQFEGMGTQDVQGLMDTMMHQLLSKEVLQEPMIEIRDRYPAWLESNKGRLSAEDWERYSKQYVCIQRLCRVYEESPSDFNLIVSVMKEMQECGQPPADIIQDLAPGLEIGEDGLPVLPDLSGGDLPPNCCIM